MATLAVVIAAAMTWTLGPRVTQLASPAANATTPADGWHPWSAEAVQRTLAEGKPVFVDFTAAWCVTCQYNKSTTLSDPGLLADFGARQVTRMRADWTRRDPAITQALASLGRSGVPVYVLYAPGRPPAVLSEVISITEVRALLATL